MNALHNLKFKQQNSHKLFSPIALFSLIVLACLSLALPLLPAQAHSHKKSGHDAHKHQQHKKQAAKDETTLTEAQALTKLDQGISAMAETMSPEKREEMFSNGPIMHNWHTHTNAIESAIAALENHSKKKPKTEQGNIEAALEQIEDSLADFHIATHDRNTKDALAQVDKAAATLKKLKSYY